jgi:alpha-L-fucosidase
MEINAGCIFGTRPWKVFGEGPTRMSGGYFSEGSQPAYTAADILFTTKGAKLYAIALAWPADGKLTIRTLGTGAGLFKHQIADVHLLGHPTALLSSRDAQALTVHLLETKPCDRAFVLKVTPRA